MIRWGVYLIVFCVLGLVLPAIGMDHMAFAYLGEARPFVVWGCGLAGALLIVAGVKRRKTDVPPPSAPN